MFSTETELRVRYVETDKMGIVHHSNYAAWFEVGRSDFIRKLGTSYSEIEKNFELWLPLIGLRCNFLGHAGYDDILIIKTRIKQYSGVRLVFYYEILKKESSKLITTGETEHVWTTQSLKPVNLKKYRPELHKLLTSAAGDDK